MIECVRSVIPSSYTTTTLSPASFHFPELNEFVILCLAFACPGPICTICRTCFAPFRQHRRGQQRSRHESGHSEQTTTGGEEGEEHYQHQHQHENEPGRELDDLPPGRNRARTW